MILDTLERLEPITLCENNPTGLQTLLCAVTTLRQARFPQSTPPSTAQQQRGFPLKWASISSLHGDSGGAFASRYHSLLSLLDFRMYAGGAFSRICSTAVGVSALRN